MKAYINMLKKLLYLLWGYFILDRYVFLYKNLIKKQEILWVLGIKKIKFNISIKVFINIKIKSKQIMLLYFYNLPFEFQWPK